MLRSETEGGVMILLNPGPVSLTPRVRSALAGGDMCHREPEFAAMQLKILERLVSVYPEARANYDAMLLAGSGTAAVEAMLASFAPREGRTLVVVNGVYGERMEEMLRRQGKPYTVVAASWESPIDMAAVEKTLAADRTITHIAAVHHETTTGRLNDVKALADLSRRYGATILLDAVSSFAGELIDFVQWPLEAIAANANKCIHGAPGASFVIAKKTCLKKCGTAANSLYLDLLTYHKMQREGGSPFTQCVPSCRALLEALNEMEEGGGWQARRERYIKLSRSLRAHLSDLGVEALVPEKDAASMLTAFKLPAGISYKMLHDQLKEKGFIIYAGQGKIAERVFRIANMGAIGDADWERLFGELARIIGGRRS